MTTATAPMIVEELRSLADPSQKERMARYGIQASRALGGIRVPTLRAMARRIGRDHRLALDLWHTGVHEARILASMVDEPAAVTEEQMEAWGGDFDSWDLVDQTCMNLFDKTPLAWSKAAQWSGRPEEFVKRAGFALMASLAVHDRSAPNGSFGSFLPIIEREAGDTRTYVRKAVNWALRQIGKRNAALNAAATATAVRIHEYGPRSARWVASDALRELRSAAVRRKLAR